MPNDRPPPGGALFVLVATALFACKGVVARLALAEGLSVFAIIALRVTMATPVYLVVAWLILRRGPSPLPTVEGGGASPRRAALEALAAGAFFLFAAGCDFAAIARIGAGPSRVILFSFPGIVMLMEAVRDRQLPRAPQALTFAVAWGGLTLVAAPEGLAALEGRDLSGALYALGGAASYATFLVASQRAMRTLGSVRFTALANVGTFLALLVVAPLWGTAEDAALPTAGVLWIVLMVVACTVLPFFLLAEGVERAGAGPASLLTLVGPPMTVVLAFFILGERLNARQIVGATLVVVAIATLKLSERRAKAPPPANELAERAA